ncbi:MAG: hypothetical protein K2Q12_08590 [Rickettsiales bacterium]|nr:hypothetical protein [Rickettsiales bacterium]
MQYYERTVFRNPADGSSRLQPRDSASAAQSLHENLRLQRPAVCFFPGVQTIEGAVHHQQPAHESLDYKSHVIERHLGDVGVYDQGLRFFGVTYSRDAKFWRNNQWMTDHTGRTIDVMRYMRKPNDYFSRDAKDFADAMLLPVFKEGDEWLPLPDIATRLRCLTFFGDSYGSIFAEQIANYLKFKLKDDFTPPQINSLLSTIVLIAASNIPKRTADARKAQVGNYTGIYFEGKGDHFIQTVRNFGRIDHVPSILKSMGGKESSPVAAPEVATDVSDSLPFETVPPPASPHKKFDEFSYPEATSLSMDSVAKSEARGMLVRFDVPQNYTYPVTIDGEVGWRHYANAQKHQSLSYSALGDQQYVLRRALRNAVQRGGHMHGVTPESLCTTPTPPLSRDPNHAAYEEAADRYTDQLLLVLQHRQRESARDAENRHTRRIADERGGWQADQRASLGR